MNTMDMTKGKPLHLMLRFALPVFVGILFQQIYNFADMLIVGIGIGEEAVAAIGATAALYSVLVNFANGLNNGYSIIIARTFGQKDVRKLRRAVAAMLSLNFLITALLTCISLVFLRSLLQFLKTPEEIFAQSYTYIFIILAGMAATISYNMGAGFMQALGNSRTPLYFLVLACFVNIVLDICFVLQLRLGIAGAAFATLISQLLSALLCFVYIYRRYRPYLPTGQDWQPNAILLREMLTTGLSMGLMLSLYSVGSVILQIGINGLDLTVVKAHTVSRKISEMLMMPIGTLSVAVATFVGQNYGAKKVERIKEAIRQIYYISLVWGLAVFLIVQFGGMQMLRLLVRSGDAEILEKAMFNLRFCTFFFFPLGVLCALRSAMQSLGYKISPVVSSGIELVLKVLFSLYLIPLFGYSAVVWAEPFIWIVCAVYLLALYHGGKKKIYAYCVT